MVDKEHKSLTLTRQCELLCINKSSLYYERRVENAENLEVMKQIDEIHTAHPYYGARRIKALMQRKGSNYNIKRIRRLMFKMGILTEYPKRNLSVVVVVCDVGVGSELGVGSEELGVMPNPTSDKLEVQSLKLKIEEIKIYNVLGCEILKQVQNDRSVIIDVSGLASGMYFVEVRTEKGIVRKKIIKQ